MDAERNKGLGSCKMEATTLVVAPLSWITEGRELQYAATVLAAVHDYNCKASVDDFIALDFPGASFRREFAGKPGVQARLIGSRTALAQALSSDRLMQFHRRSIIDEKTAGIQSLISPFEPLESGYCLTRSQKSARTQPGTIRRKIARAIRRGHNQEHIAALEAKMAESGAMTAEQRRITHQAPREAAIFLGEKPFFFTRKKVTAKSYIGKVSTYGMSSQDAPVIFDKWVEDNGSANEKSSSTSAGIMVGLFDEEHI